MLSLGRFKPLASEDFAMTVGDRTLTVRVKRHHASRRYRLRYDAAKGELRLTMPPRQRIGPAYEWVQSQQHWVAKQVAARPSGGIAVGPGASIPWHGEFLTIDWQAHAPRTPRLVDDRLLLGGPEESVAARVKRWLRAQARSEFDARTRAMAAAEELVLSSVSVGDPRSRWGSCSSSGKIRYSWRLAMAPEVVRHAIVAHEVAHLAHMNHGPEFHALADRLGGAANAVAKRWLKAHGASLQALQFDAR